MRRRPALAAWLTAVWVMLWGDITLANVVGGALAATLLLTVFPDAGPRAGGTVRPVAAVRLVGYFLYKLIEANAIVAWEVVTPSNASVREAVVAVPVTGASDAVITILANAISLTPGTLTLEVRRDPAVLFVHVLHLRSVAETRRDVRHLEHLVLKAFGSAAALQAHRDEEAAT